MGIAKLYSQSGSDGKINGIVQEYYVYAGEIVEKGDFVELLTGSNGDEKETQVRKATTSDIYGVAKTSGEGGAELPSNLITNGDFSNGLNGWTVSGTDYFTTELTTKEGKSCVEITLTAPATAGSYTSIAVLYPTHSAIEEGHIYYTCFRYFGDVSNNYMQPIIRQRSGSAQALTGDTTGWNVEEWQWGRFRRQASLNFSGQLEFDLYAQNGNDELTAGMKMYFTDFRFYDLTALYGSGNEPTQEWCDENLTKEVGHKDIVSIYTVEEVIPEPEPDFIASASDVREGYPPYLAFDRNEETVYFAPATLSTAPIRLTIKLDKEINAKKVRISTRGEGVGNRPDNFRIEGSNDGQNWHTLLTRTSVITDTVELTLTETGWYQYYSIYIISNANDETGTVIEEFQITAWNSETGEYIPKMSDNTLIL